MVKWFRHRIRNKLRTLLVVFYFKGQPFSRKKQSVVLTGFVLLFSLGIAAASPLRQQNINSIVSETGEQQSQRFLTSAEPEIKVDENAHAEPKESVVNTPTTESETSVKVEVRSSTSSRLNGEKKNETKTHYSNDHRKEVRHESSDGNSRVRFHVSANEDAEVKVRDRGGRVKIEVKEKKD